MKIFINPGHCVDSDSGACGYRLSEADVALNIGKLTADYLIEAGYDTYLFQYDGLAEIVDEANDWNADLFVSIHCNAANGYAQGTETFYFSSEGQELADAIQSQIVDRLGTLDRGIKPAEFFVIAHTDCPAVLVETAFIDNYDDNQLLADYQDDFARAIACGITDYVVGK